MLQFSNNVVAMGALLLKILSISSIFLNLWSKK
nr:MAG TPA: hypothetical protein [Caudoviricetes sp.]DAY37426.1 MAG TPA: hypothetical protein [Caudoviricetes sp.]